MRGKDRLLLHKLQPFPRRQNQVNFLHSGMTATSGKTLGHLATIQLRLLGLPVLALR